jgi:hypothetical protein
MEMWPGSYANTRLPFDHAAQRTALLADEKAPKQS